MTSRTLWHALYALEDLTRPLCYPLTAIALLGAAIASWGAAAWVWLRVAEMARGWVG